MSVDEAVTYVIGAVAVIAAVAWSFGLLARRLRQPEIIGHIFAGITLGPGVLGHLAGGVDRMLFPPAVVSYLNAIGQIGLVLALFSVGYELDLRSLRSRRLLIPVTAACAFVLPMLLGGGSVFVFGSLYAATDGHEPRSWAFVLFIAVAMSITAVPVLAGIIRERNAAGTLPAVVATATAGVIDVLGWLALTAALLLAQKTSHSAGHRGFGVTLLLFLGYLAAMVCVVRPAMLAWLRRPGALVRQNTTLICAVAMGSAWVTQALGLHAIIGALLAGLITPRASHGIPDIDLAAPFQQAGDLLLMIYFAVSGMSVQPGALRGAGFALFCVVLAIAVLGKVGGGLLGGRLAGLTTYDATVVGVLINTRGLTELIALNVGLQAGLLNRPLYTVMVFMALVTTVATGALLTRLRFPRDEPLSAVRGGAPEPGLRISK